jgi:NAD-dependent deacetylase
VSKQLEHARRLVENAKAVVFFTGAGMSADSGIPTFRDVLTGLWAKYDPTELATPEAFGRDPALVWNFYEFRRSIVRKCAPNAGHRAIAAFEKTGRPTTVVTQNVDGFHQLAGSSRVLCLHGNIMEDRCQNGCPGVTPAIGPVDEGEPVPPVCPQCGERTIRPNVVWFGEALDETTMLRAGSAVHDCDLMVVVGTSGVVYPAAGLADVALRMRKAFIEINPDPTQWSDKATVYVPGRASEALPEVLNG